MRLSAYLEETRETPSSFAKSIGVSAVAVHRYLRQGRIPEPAVMAKIVAVTRSRVRPDDFYGIPPVKRPAPRRSSRRSAEGR